MAKITSIVAREIIDSRGDPTIQAIVYCEGGIYGSAMVPSGISTGIYEVSELRDQDPTRFNGKGVLQAIAHITHEISPALIGYDTGNQEKIDKRMIQLDGTEQKSRLGANAILAVSLACARAEARAQGIELYALLMQGDSSRQPLMPVPQMNLVNGGKHASNDLAIQEFHILPVGAKDFATALRMGVEIHHAMKTLLVQEGFQTELGDEGGYAPKLSSSEDVFTLIVRAIEQSKYVPGVDVCLGIDAAASEFYEADQSAYRIDGSVLHANDLAYRYKDWKDRYPLISLEDPFDQDAWDDWSKFVAAHGDAVQVVGDDLYATHPTRITEGVQKKSSNAVLIKPNQIGTLTETLEAISIAQAAGQNVIISHRSGETEDTFIADLAVAVGAGQIKTGAPARSERTSKYNRLLQIEAELHPPMSHAMQRFYEHSVVRHTAVAQDGIVFTPQRV